MKIKKIVAGKENFRYLKAGQWFRKHPWEDFQEVGRNDGSQIILTDFRALPITEENQWDAVETVKIEWED